nr:GDP-mannose 4,6-dehydratase [Mangrovicoccus ximenensis]
MSRGEDLEIWGDGTVVRDFIYVKDMADICVAALESEKSGIYNAGAGEGTSVNQIVEAVRHATGRDFQPTYKVARAYDVPRIVLDIRRAQEDFGWSPKVPLVEGVAESWKWVQSQAAAVR